MSDYTPEQQAIYDKVKADLSTLPGMSEEIIEQTARGRAMGFEVPKPRYRWPPPQQEQDDVRVDDDPDDDPVEGHADALELDKAALYGIAGDFVGVVEPDTEAAPVAILLQVLAAFGTLVGRGPHYLVERDQHHANLFLLLVGTTSKARKGTSWGRVLDVFRRIPEWKAFVSGLSSGEGVKYHVRDAREEPKKNTRTGENVLEIVDAGIEDKRLLVIEQEFGGVLRVAQRQGSSLTATIREAWDSGNLSTLTKNDPVRATGAHISIVAHITSAELRNELTGNDIANGLANRFLFAQIRRSKLLPHGGGTLDEDVMELYAKTLRERMQTARTRHRVVMTTGARQLWEDVYPDLSAEREGLHGSITARAEAQTIRLALLYCLLDGEPAIDVAHLQAALGLWAYCDGTVLQVFGDRIGDTIADAILLGLARAGSTGLSRTQINYLFHRNETSSTIGNALESLLVMRRVICESVRTGGRPSEVWKLARVSGRTK